MPEPGAVDHVAAIGQELPEGLAGLGRSMVEQHGAESFATHFEHEPARVGGDGMRDLETIIPPAVPHLALRGFVMGIKADIVAVAHGGLLGFAWTPYPRP